MLNNEGFTISPSTPTTPEENPSPLITNNRININTDKKPKFAKKTLFLIFGFLSLVIIGGVALALTRPNGYKSPLEDKAENSSEDKKANVVEMFENPINGMKFTIDEAMQFRDKKPIAVMVNNYVDARPSAGINQADIVFEVVAEGGITRLMPIFFSRIPEKVSSIRSARYYFVELASSYHPHYIHWGAAHVPPCQKSNPPTCPPVGGKVETNPEVDAYDRIVELGLPNLDGGNYSCDAVTCAFGRDPEKLGKVALEHTAFVRLPLIYAKAKDIRPQEAWHKYTAQSSVWKFKDDPAETERGDIGLTKPITYNYWDTMAGFNVKWEYDKATNTYLRYQGGVKIIDALDKQDVNAKVVIIRFTKEMPVNDKKNHLYHEIIGNGKALIFMDGKATEATWKRFTHEDVDTYEDMSGNEIVFTRGQIWVQLVPDTNIVDYKVKTTESSSTPSTGIE